MAFEPSQNFRWICSFWIKSRNWLWPAWQPINEIFIGLWSNHRSFGGLTPGTLFILWSLRTKKKKKVLQTHGPFGYDTIKFLLGSEGVWKNKPLLISTICILNVQGNLDCFGYYVCCGDNFNTPPLISRWNVTLQCPNLSSRPLQHCMFPHIVEIVLGGWFGSSMINYF